MIAPPATEICSRHVVNATDWFGDAAEEAFRVLLDLLP